MTRIYKIQRKHGEKWYAKVNYTIAGIHYQKKSPVFDTQKEARAAEIELQEWVRQVIQEAELGHTEPPTKLCRNTRISPSQRHGNALSGSLRRPMDKYGKSTETRPKSKN